MAIGPMPVETRLVGSGVGGVGGSVGGSVVMIFMGADVVGGGGGSGGSVVVSGGSGEGATGFKSVGSVSTGATDAAADGKELLPSAIGFRAKFRVGTKTVVGGGEGEGAGGCCG